MKYTPIHQTEDFDVIQEIELSVNKEQENTKLKIIDTKENVDVVDAGNTKSTGNL